MSGDVGRLEAFVEHAGVVLLAEGRVAAAWLGGSLAAGTGDALRYTTIARTPTGEDAPWMTSLTTDSAGSCGAAASSMAATPA